MSRVEALLRERQGYVLRNLPARIKQVDAELARLGFAAETVVADAAVETAEARPTRTPKAKPVKPEIATED